MSLLRRRDIVVHTETRLGSLTLQTKLQKKSEPKMSLSFRYNEMLSGMAYFSTKKGNYLEPACNQTIYIQKSLIVSSVNGKIET